MKRCPSCDGELTERDAQLDLHISGLGACFNAFPTQFTPWEDSDWEDKELITTSDHNALGARGGPAATQVDSGS